MNLNARVDANVDGWMKGQTNRQMNGQMVENLMPISHLHNWCEKNIAIFLLYKVPYLKLCTWMFSNKQFTLKIICMNWQALFSWDKLGPVVQSIVSLTSSLRVISLTVLADSIHNILIFFAEKMWVAFALQKLLTFFQQKISAYSHITRCKF